MVVGPVRNGYIHVGVSQGLCHIHAAEPAAHHQHLMPSACLAGQSRAAGLVRHRHRLALQPLVAVLSVGLATASAISLANRVAPLALVPRTPAMRTVTTLCAATAFSPGGCRASYGRCALGGADSVTYPIGT